MFTKRMLLPRKHAPSSGALTFGAAVGGSGAFTRTSGPPWLLAGGVHYTILQHLYTLFTKRMLLPRRHAPSSGALTFGAAVGGSGAFTRTSGPPWLLAGGVHYTTAATFVYALGAGITAAAGTRLALQLILIAAFG